MHIDIFHDTACPWCRIGKRHLRLALEAWDGEPVTARYRTFFLNETIPPEGDDFKTYMTAKGNGRIPLEHFFDGPRRAGAAVGLTFNFERITRAPNTFPSHQLIALTPDEHKEDVVDAIYDAYFEHGQDIGDLGVLAQIADAHGLNGRAIEEQIHAGAARDIVLADARWARQHGIGGVPFFVLDGAYGLSGAQPPRTMLQAIRQVAEREQTIEQ